MKKISIVESSTGKTVLSKFIASSATTGIRAGFEAELCFSQKNTLVSSNPTYEDDLSINPKPTSLAHIVKFLTLHKSPAADITKLTTAFTAQYKSYINKHAGRYWKDVEEEEVEKYINTHVFNKETEIIKVLNRFRLSKASIAKQIKTKGPDWQDAFDEVSEKFRQLVQDTIEEQDEIYDLAKEAALTTATNLSELDFLESKGLDLMKDVTDDFLIDWPIRQLVPLIIDAPFSVNVGTEVGKSLMNKLTVPVRLGTGYGTATRDNIHWIVEPDTSVKPDVDGDFGAELISPPMQLNIFFKKLDEFFKWAVSNDAYANESTGFHIGVSLPDGSGKIDYIKLVLFLGDFHMLKRFSRETNKYCAPAAENIYSHLRDVSKVPDSASMAYEDALSVKLDHVFKLIKDGCISIASSLVSAKNDHKYTSVNVKEGYIEFRIAGNAEYINRIDDIKHAVARYAYAMTIASDPEMFKEEYAVKLYKFLNNARAEETPSMELFADYISGTLTSDGLKQLYLKNKYLKSKLRSRSRSTSTGSRIPGPRPPSRN